MPKSTAKSTTDEVAQGLARILLNLTHLCRRAASVKDWETANG